MYVINLSMKNIQGFWSFAIYGSPSDSFNSSNTIPNLILFYKLKLYSPNTVDNGDKTVYFGK